MQKGVDTIRLEFQPGTVAKVGLSIGMANYPKDGCRLETLLERADRAMYQNKQNRKLATLIEVYGAAPLSHAR